MQAQSLGWEDSLEEEIATHSGFAWKSHGQRSLAGYSPKSWKELDMTEQLNTNIYTIIFEISEIKPF